MAKILLTKSNVSVTTNAATNGLANSGTLIHPLLSTVIYGEHKFNTTVFVTQVFAATSGDIKRHHKECFVMKIFKISNPCGDRRFATLLELCARHGEKGDEGDGIIGGSH